MSAAIGQVRLVREAQVERTWPRGLKVTVRPRQAVLAVKEGNAWSLVDDQRCELVDLSFHARRNGTDHAA